MPCSYINTNPSRNTDCGNRIIDGHPVILADTYPSYVKPGAVFSMLSPNDIRDDVKTMVHGTWELVERREDFLVEYGFVE